MCPQAHTPIQYSYRQIFEKVAGFAWKYKPILSKVYTDFGKHSNLTWNICSIGVTDPHFLETLGSPATYLERS